MKEDEKLKKYLGVARELKRKAVEYKSDSDTNLGTV